MPVCLKSAEPFYKPSVLTPARSNNRCGFERNVSSAGRTLRYAGGSAPARRPDPKPRATDTSKLEKKLTSVFCVDSAVEVIGHKTTRYRNRVCPIPCSTRTGE